MNDPKVINYAEKFEIRASVDIPLERLSLCFVGCLKIYKTETMNLRRSRKFSSFDIL